MPTYFGNTTPYASWDSLSGYAVWNTGQTFTCPGSGNQTIKELSAYVGQTGAANLRLAIYNSAGTTKIAEGTGAVAIVSSTGAWEGHMTQASISPNPATLVGGTAYKIATSGDSGNGYFAQQTGAANSWGYADGYIAGYPASLPSPTQFDLNYNLRCGVDAAAGGLNWVQLENWWKRTAYTQ